MKKTARTLNAEESLRTPDTLGSAKFRHSNASVQVTDTGTDARLIDKPEVAERLRRSKRTVDSWMKQGKLPYLKIGKSVLFRWSDVIEKLNSFRVN
jgi:excisionase family DNA binding protein